MKMSSAFKTVLLATNLLLSQAGFSQNHKAPAAKNSTTTQSINEPVLNKVWDARLIYDTVNHITGLEYDLTPVSGGAAPEHKMSIFALSREELKKRKIQDYNAVLVNVGMDIGDNKQLIPNSMWGQGEQAVLLIAKDKRHQLTDEMKKNGAMLKKFINTPGNVIEVERGITLNEYLLFQENSVKDKSSDKDSYSPFVLLVN
jgi:hypothetical protein